MIKLALTSFLTLCSFVVQAQLKPESKVHLTFEEVSGEVNVNGEDALLMLEDYIKDKTSLIIVDDAESSDFIMKLSVVEKNMGNRRGSLILLDSKTAEAIFNSKWVKGTMNAFYGYSGSRHAIGRLVKSELISQYPEIGKD